MQNNPLNGKAEETQKQRRGIAKWKVVAFFMAIYDFVAVCAAYFLTLFFRFDEVFRAIPKRYLLPYRNGIFPIALASTVVFLLYRMYNSMWKYASVSDFTKTFLGSIMASLLHTVLITACFRRMPLTYYILGVGF